jgi:heavy metal sensor kinase
MIMMLTTQTHEERQGAKKMKLRMERIWPLGIRLQLILWYTSVFTVILLIAGMILYVQLQNALSDSFDPTLQTQAQMISEDIIDDIREAGGRITIQKEAANVPDFNIDTNNKLTRYKSSFGPMIGLFDAQGIPVRETVTFKDLSIPSPSILSSMRGNSWLGTTTNRGGSPVRLYSQPLLVHDKIFAIIQVAQSLGSLYDTLKHITKELLQVGLLVLLLSAIGIYLLTYRAFAPIRRLIQTARAIKAGDLRKRVLVPRAQDEVRFLAVTLNEMIAHLDEMFTRQRRFVADASHELRTPIAAIRSKTDVELLQMDLPGEYATVLQEINTETVRLSHLINDLLALARGDEGQIQFEYEPVQLDRLAETVVANAEALATGRGVTLETRITERITIHGDETRLIQMIINLLDNAILYTNAGGSVTLTVKQVQAYVVLTIQDTGIGIAPEHLPHIFERFYRADPAHIKTERGSSGLGLAIVEWIVRAHEGNIMVESQLGQGSTFIVRLPIARASVTAK